jgi:serine-type D-Ala-D-Ala carboxypeptidase (penicillin-binding protein 5/6)
LPLSDGSIARSYSLQAVPRSLALLLLLAALALGWAAIAAAAAPPPTSARAVLVANGKTGEILYERNADRRLPMASITKLMSALVTLEHAEPQDVVTVRGPAPSVGESSIDLAPGERLPVRDLLAAALIQSANDSAYALAAHVGEGSVARFVALMNEEADELGLDDTRYVRPDGLDTPGHYSSAEESFQLARRAMQEPLVRKLVRKRSHTIAGGRSLRTWNDLLATFPGLVGVKTGHTDLAGWSEVAAARRDGITVYAVILGSPSRARRNADLAELLEWGFDQYGRVTLVSEGERYTTAAIPFSDERVGLVALEGAERVIRLDSGVRFVQRVVAPAMLELPVEQGERLGEVVVLDGEHVVARRPLVAARAVPEPSFGARFDWYADQALDEAEGMLGTVFGAFG